MTTPLTYSAKSAAVRAAKAALGAEAIPGTDFTVQADGKRWAWAPAPAAEAPQRAAEPRTFAPRTKAVKMDSAPTDFGGDDAPTPVKRTRKATPEGGPKNSKPATMGKRAQIEADAQAGKLPKAPDFSADTHKRWRKALGEVEALIKARDLKGLRAYPINPVSSSRKALDRYRNLAVLALEAKAGKAAPKTRPAEEVAETV